MRISVGDLSRGISGSTVKRPLYTDTWESNLPSSAFPGVCFMPFATSLTCRSELLGLPADRFGGRTHPALDHVRELTSEIVQ
ncbi:MAG: hypothetical protein DWQ45_16135 [Planctomycetota bacterium]|nr:MAG: hypothetical protein DWQ29_09565 [Planctomycetota bacterium]REK30750.1 MAG: hypothetical protein DWQ41_02030 [Planctomycetota bacterium]REK33125.1 MAG: hypothetical protein DWQ45_16135 [Planctomycetota bacterium]